MNYYKRHLGDYARDTGDLTMLQHGAFGLLLDRYYSDERPLKASKVYAIGKARNQAERDAVDFVLKEYFSLADGLWSNAKADSVIESSKKKSKSCSDAAKSNKINGSSERTLSENQANAEQESSERCASHKPLAINHKPVEKDQEKEHVRPTAARSRPAPTMNRFDEFCAVYPRREGLAVARGKWKMKNLDAVADKIIADIRKRIDGGHWTDPKYVPLMSTYINQQRWEDQVGTGGDLLQSAQQSHSRAAGRPLE